MGTYKPFSSAKRKLQKIWSQQGINEWGVEKLKKITERSIDNVFLKTKTEIIIADKERLPLENIGDDVVFTHHLEKNLGPLPDDFIRFSRVLVYFSSGDDDGDDEGIFARVDDGGVEYNYLWKKVGDDIIFQYSLNLLTLPSDGEVRIDRKKTHIDFFLTVKVILLNENTWNEIQSNKI